MTIQISLLTILFLGYWEQNSIMIWTLIILGSVKQSFLYILCIFYLSSLLRSWSWLSLLMTRGGGVGWKENFFFIIAVLACTVARGKAVVVLFYSLLEVMAVKAEPVSNGSYLPNYKTKLLKNLGVLKYFPFLPCLFCLCFSSYQITKNISEHSL